MAGSHEVRGSIPLGSTTDSRGARRRRRAPLFLFKTLVWRARGRAGEAGPIGAYGTKSVSDFGRWRGPAPIFYGESRRNRLSRPGEKHVRLLAPSQAAWGDPRQKAADPGRMPRTMRNARPAEGPWSGAGGPRRAPGGGGLPIRRHRAPVAAVPPRYVAEVGLYARFPAHVQLPDHAVAHGRLLPKGLDPLGSSVGPRAVAELVKMRWRDWRAYGGANGQSALAEMAVFAVAPTTAPGSRAAAWRSWPAATSARCPLASPRSGLVVETPPQGWAARARR